MGVNPSTGLISGTPLATGTFTPTISAINLGGTGSATLSVSLSAPPVPVIAGTLSATGTSGVAFDYQIAASNNPTSYGASSLPQGLSVSSSTGLISGMPATIGTFSAIISATNAGGFDSEALTLNILPLPPAIISGLAASGVMGSAFDYQIVATNNPASFTATGLPPGLSVNASTGLISGTPTASGMFATTIGVTNANTAAKDNLWLMVTENLNRSAGSYEGLGAIGGTNVGLFTMSLTAKGGFTGKLRVAGATYPLKGTFSSYGTFSSIRSVGANTLDIALSVNPAVPEVSGIITTITASENNSYSVEGSLLRKYNANTLPKGLSGNYSSVIPGVSGTDLVLPHEPGHGTMSVASTGAVHIVGKLGDGTAFGARGQLHADGKTFTLFDALYAGKNPGTIAGNIILESSTNSDWDADLDWIKPAQPGATNYPGGFSVSVDLLATKNASPAPLAKTAPLSPSPQLSPPLPRP